MTEIELIEKAAIKVGMTSFLNHGAASCVSSEGCNGVTQDHLVAFAREIALHCAVALATPTEGAAEPVHSDHPLRHWDRSCPACNASIDYSTPTASGDMVSVPEGWKLVPREACESQLQAGEEVDDGCIYLRSVYRAMIDAAPTNAAGGDVAKDAALIFRRGYHALVQVVYKLRQDGQYADDEGEETDALEALALAIEKQGADMSAAPSVAKGGEA